MEERCCSNPSPTSLSKPSFQFWKFSCFKWPYLPFLRLAQRRFTSEELSNLLNILNCLEYVSFEVSILCIHSKGRLQYYCKKYHHSQSRISLHTSVWSSLDSHSFACKASGEFAIWAENIQKYAEVHIFKQLLMHSLKLKSCLLPGFEIAKIAKNFVPVRTVTRTITPIFLRKNIGRFF